MKKQKITIITAASLAAAALSVSPLAFGQSQSSAGSTYNQPASAGSSAEQNSRSNQESSANATMSMPTAEQNATASSQYGVASSANGSATQSLRLASKDESKHMASRLAGRKVRGSDGKDIGTVKDFLVDPSSGEIRFAVISTGGFMGMGDKLHLVPFQSLQQSSDEKQFTLAMSKEQLSQAQAVNEEQFEENRVSAHADSSATAATEGSTASVANLVRATKLHGRDVKADGNKIGSIEGLVIEQGSTTALALLDPAKDVAGAGQKFLVPLGRFTMAGKNDITTTLTRADFQAVTTSDATASLETSKSASTTNVAADTASTNANVSSTRQSQNVAGDATSGTTAVGALAPTGGNATYNQPGSVAVNTTDTTSTSASTSQENAPADKTMSASHSQFAAGTSNAADVKSTDSNSTDASMKATDQSADVAATSKKDAKNTDAVASNNESATMPSATTAQDSTDSKAASDYAGTTLKDDARALTPTGQTSADQTPAGDPKLITAAHAIRTALDNDATTAHADVRVLPEDGKIALKGKVNTESEKTSIESKARQAANGCEIDSQLKVGNQ